MNETRPMRLSVGILTEIADLPDAALAYGQVLNALCSGFPSLGEFGKHSEVIRDLVTRAARKRRSTTALEHLDTLRGTLPPVADFSSDPNERSSLKIIGMKSIMCEALIDARGVLEICPQSGGCRFFCFRTRIYWFLSCDLGRFDDTRRDWDNVSTSLKAIRTLLPIPEEPSVFEANVHGVDLNCFWDC